MHLRICASLTRTFRPQARTFHSLSSAHCARRDFLLPRRLNRLQSAYSTSGSTPIESRSFTDPARPDLHYHLSAPTTSSTVIGWLPAAATSSDHEAGLNDFKENPEFRALLHQVIQDGLREKVDAVQINGATQLGNGWMHIHDERNIPALGRIGDPDDIIASVLIEDGEIQAETYQAMPSYRICTSDGPTQLTPGLAQKLRAVLEVRARSESER
ncbi:hypothetical protein K438DRAFT_1813667 [Mycena galopus ATCC 62051]|nr:hypothetical protein K438DRAFT_1813667 [Mycena galopus ATCC 62051]